MNVRQKIEEAISDVLVGFYHEERIDEHTIRVTGELNDTTSNHYMWDVDTKSGDVRYVGIDRD